MEVRAQLGRLEPTCRKLGPTIGHVLAAKHPQRQHQSRRELWLEAGVEVASHAFGPRVRVSALHQVVDRDHFHSL